MIKDYIIRPYYHGDEEAIVELLELVFDGWPHFDLTCAPLDHWRWKHEDNPLKTNVIFLGIIGGKIISCLHTIPKMLKIGGKIFLSWERVDGAVHPDFRKMGLFNKMSELTYESMMMNEIKIQYGNTNNPILIEKYLKQGNPHLPYSAVHFVRIHDVELHLKMVLTKSAWLKKYGFHLVKLCNKFRNTLRRSPSSDQDFSISEVSSFDDRINAFWDEIKDHYNFVMQRTREYVNWRYCDPRGGDYIIKMAEADGQVLGYSVLRINRYNKDYPKGYIVDLITLPKRLDVTEGLVEDAINYFDSHNINIIYCQIIKNHPHEAIAKRFGFVDSRSKPFMHYIPSTGIDEELKKLQTSTVNRIHYVYGDYDWF